jgi:alkylation response protein AidB-like acyl-CoA dehydrogenase
VDFEIVDSPEQREFRAVVRDWLAENVPDGISLSPGPRDHPHEEYKLRRLLGRRLGEKGWLYPQMPPEFGGGGLDIERAMVIYEEMDARGFGLPPYYDSGGVIAGPTILIWGSAEQKRALIPRICGGEVRTWMLLSETEAGSDLAAVRMTAVRDGDDYVLNGQKTFIGSDHGAEEFWTLTLTDPGGKRHENLSWFLVPSDLPGIRIVPMDLLGAGGEGGSGDGAKNNIFFDNVRVPAFRLIGGENNGWRVANTTLELEHGAGGRPTPNQLIPRFLEYCRQTLLDGRPMSENPEIQSLLVEIYQESEITRLFGLRNFWLRHARRPQSYEGSQYSYVRRMNNLRISTLLQRVLGYGALTNDSARRVLEGYVELFMRSSIIGLHPGGTADIQKLTMARRIGVGRAEREEAGRLH